MANFSNLDSSSKEVRGSIPESGIFSSAVSVRSGEPAENDLTQDAETSSRNKERPRVSVIVVTYSSSDEIPDCMESLLKQSTPLEIFLVDNASPDNTGQVVSNYAAQFANVHAILNEKNVGLAAGNNTPMGRCSGGLSTDVEP